jgi:hypothetical protein
MLFDSIPLETDVRAYTPLHPEPRHNLDSVVAGAVSAACLIAMRSR